jgi:uncharacterized protein involved in response to NO
MTTTAEQVRSYRGPAILSYGFRPFFLLGAIWSALAVAIWLPLLAGSLTLPITLSPVEWHVHELLYGYLPAIAAGFLLTAVPNWTGRLPVTGMPLLVLLLVWIAGRLAMLISAWVGGPAAATVDVLFLATLVCVIGREIIHGSSKQNLKVLVLIGLLLVGNVVFHLESMRPVGTSGYGMRIGIGTAILLITVIGGRIIPSFTRNWLARRPPGSMPTAFNRFDVIAIAGGAAAIALWVVAPRHYATAMLALIATLLHAIRLARWAGYRTLREPLVAVLHVAYAFVPIGFLLVSSSIVAPVLIAASGALHCWTAGAIGLMTLAVMTRASLGHTGQPLTATVPVQLVYLAVVIAAVARIVAAFDIARAPLLHLAATAWVAAFGGFAIIYWPLLTRYRRAR